jgi:hypothetical protein
VRPRVHHFHIRSRGAGRFVQAGSVRGVRGFGSQVARGQPFGCQHLGAVDPSDDGVAGNAGGTAGARVGSANVHCRGWGGSATDCGFATQAECEPQLILDQKAGLVLFLFEVSSSHEPSPIHQSQRVAHGEGSILLGHRIVRLAGAVFRELPVFPHAGHSGFVRHVNLEHL